MGDPMTSPATPLNRDGLNANQAKPLTHSSDFYSDTQFIYDVDQLVDQTF